jgi:hypothetical protein
MLKIECGVETTLDINILPQVEWNTAYACFHLLTVVTTKSVTLSKIENGK